MFEFVLLAGLAGKGSLEKVDEKQKGMIMFASLYLFFLSTSQSHLFPIIFASLFIFFSRAGVCVPDALKKSKCSPAIQEFVSDTFNIINTNKVLITHVSRSDGPAAS